LKRIFPPFNTGESGSQIQIDKSRDIVVTVLLCYEVVKIIKILAQLCPTYFRNLFFLSNLLIGVQFSIFYISPFCWQFFTSEPVPCDPSSLPKYAPSKEIDAKLRDEARRYTDIG